MLSNSATPFIQDLYRGYDVKIIPAQLAINYVASKRVPIEDGW